jgi:hypothetical protein
MEDELLWANIDVIVEAHASGTGAEPPYRYAFTRCITKLLLRRTHERVLELIKNGTLARGTLQFSSAAKTTRPRSRHLATAGCTPAGCARDRDHRRGFFLRNDARSCPMAPS